MANAQVETQFVRNKFGGQSLVGGGYRFMDVGHEIGRVGDPIYSFDPFAMPPEPAFTPRQSMMRRFPVPRTRQPFSRRRHFSTNANRFPPYVLDMGARPRSSSRNRNGLRSRHILRDRSRGGRRRNVGVGGRRMTSFSTSGTRTNTARSSRTRNVNRSARLSSGSRRGLGRATNRHDGPQPGLMFMLPDTGRGVSVSGGSRGPSLHDLHSLLHMLGESHGSTPHSRAASDVMGGIRGVPNVISGSRVFDRTRAPRTRVRHPAGINSEALRGPNGQIIVAGTFPTMNWLSSQGIVGNNNPGIMGNSQGTLGISQGIMGSSEGTLGNSRGLMGSSHGTLGNSQGVMGSSQGTLGNYQGIMGSSQRTLGNSQGVMESSQGTLGNSRGIMGSSQGTLGNSHGIMGSPQGTLGNYQGVMGSSQGTLGNSQGIMGSSQGTLGNSQGIMGSSQGVGGVNQRVTHEIVNSRPGTIGRNVERIRVPQSESGVAILRRIGGHLVLERLGNGLIMNRNDLTGLYLWGLGQGQRGHMFGEEEVELDEQVFPDSPSRNTATQSRQPRGIEILGTGGNSVNLQRNGRGGITLSGGGDGGRFGNVKIARGSRTGNQPVVIGSSSSQSQAEATGQTFTIGTALKGQGITIGGTNGTRGSNILIGGSNGKGRTFTLMSHARSGQTLVLGSGPGAIELGAGASSVQIPGNATFIIPGPKTRATQQEV